jgi:hypothetical protein
MIKFGVIHALERVNGKLTGRAGVSIETPSGNYVAGPIPFLFPSTEQRKFFAVPDAGQLVACILDDEENGVILGAIYSEKNRPPADAAVDETILRGDQHGGIPKVPQLLSKINSLESEINSLKTVLASWTPVPMDGGAALKAVAATWFAVNIVLTTRQEIENEKIKHG